MKLWTGQTISELGSRITRDGAPAELFAEETARAVALSGQANAIRTRSVLVNGASAAWTALAIMTAERAVAGAVIPRRASCWRSASSVFS